MKACSSLWPLRCGYLFSDDGSLVLCDISDTSLPPPPVFLPLLYMQNIHRSCSILYNITQYKRNQTRNVLFDSQIAETSTIIRGGSRLFFLDWYKEKTKHRCLTVKDESTIMGLERRHADPLYGLILLYYGVYTRQEVVCNDQPFSVTCL